MSSIRPLATITLLMLAGLFLWWKINETEPVIPEGVGDYPIAAGLEIGENNAGGFAAAPPSVAPDAYAYPTGDAAPAYDPNAAASQAAPSWNPPAASNADQADASQDVAGAQVGMPEMPTVPNVAGEEESPEEIANDQLAMTVTPHIIQGQEDEAQLGMSDNGETSEAGNAPYGDSGSGNSANGNPATYEETSPAAAQADSTAGSSDATTPTPQSSLFGATRAAVQGTLDRGQLSQALLLLSDWYGDPSLTSEETDEVNNLLSQLAGSVIYSMDHRLEPAYRVQAGETLQQIAAKYSVPWQLLAKINGITTPDQLQAGQELKVISGPFNAKVDVSSREMVLMLGRRYAGRFKIDVNPDLSIEDGSWLVDQKLITPSGGLYSTPNETTEIPSLVLSNPAVTGGQVALIRGPADPSQVASEPAARTLRLGSAAAQDVYDILSIGSRVTIQR